MFIIAAVVILIISFIVALLSLLREQKKISDLTHVQETKNHYPVDPNAVSQNTVEKKTIQDEDSGPGREIAPEVNKSGEEDSSVRADMETVPFPWEVKSPNLHEPKPFVDGSDPAVPGEQTSPKLYPKNTTTGPMAGLHGSISLKDLKK